MKKKFQKNKVFKAAEIKVKIHFNLNKFVKNNNMFFILKQLMLKN